MPPFGYVAPGLAPGRAALTSGSVSSGSIVSGAIVSGNIGYGNPSANAGQTFLRGDLSWTDVSTITIVSGQLSRSVGVEPVLSGTIASGAVVNLSRSLMDDSFTADETLSGFCPVAFSSGNRLVTAQGASGLRMPAWGVAAGNFLSGAAALIVSHGKLLVTSGMDRLWSGQVGKPLFVSSSGDLMTPTLPLATTLSQQIGIALSGGLFVMPNLILASGGASLQSGAV